MFDVWSVRSLNGGSASEFFWKNWIKSQKKISQDSRYSGRVLIPGLKTTKKERYTDFNVMFGLTVVLKHQAVKRVRSWRSHSFLNLIFLVWLFLPIHCTCRGLPLYLITLSDIRTFRRTPLDDGSARPRDIYLYNTQHSLERNMHAPGWIRTCNSSKRAAADLRS
jgi:hypothetical protein